jgi:hypothetical protein
MRWLSPAILASAPYNTDKNFVVEKPPIEFTLLILVARASHVAMGTNQVESGKIRNCLRRNDEFFEFTDQT